MENVAAMEFGIFILKVRDAFKKKTPYGGTLFQLGGEGVKKTLKCPYLKYHFTRELFFRGGGSQIIISFVLFVEIGFNA